MKKLVLHSDQVAESTQVDKASIQLFASEDPKIAYIPSQSDLERKYFNQKVKWYEQFGITDLLYFDIDQEYDERKISELLHCDGIFLSGGNTYYFLNLLKKRGFIPILRNFVKQGGVLIGVSAGSIIMSRTITITTIDGDPNNIGLKEFSALGLNNFDFFPHFDKNNQNILKKLKKYSKRVDPIIYACKDGDGIIINNGSMEFFGEVFKIENGEVDIV